MFSSELHQSTNMEADSTRERRLIVEETEQAANERTDQKEKKKEDITDEKPEKKITKRVESLDIFRGLTVVLMILVDDAGGKWQMIGHAPWNGCNLADFVMPFFLFIVGMAIPLAFKKIPDWVLAVKKVVVRTIKLIFWGLILQGGYSHAPDKLTYGVDMKHIRWCGILQRIALSYLVVALLEISTKKAQSKDLSLGRRSIFRQYCWQWLTGVCVLAVYLSVLYGMYVPDWNFTVYNKDSPDYGKVLTVACGVRGKLDQPCNAVGYIDRKVLGINHMYIRPAWSRSKACSEKSPYEGPLRKDAPSWCQAPFEPEGILSSISAILTTIIGVHCGHVLVHMKGHLDRLKHWFVMGLILLILGIVLHFTNAIPLNKQLYTFSYVCLTAGSAALVFSFFYVVVDILGLNYVFLPLKWIGMNAMLVYVMAAEGIFAGFINGWYYDDPRNTLAFTMFCTCWSPLLMVSINSMADLLDTKTHLHWCVAFNKGWDSPLCHLCRDPFLGHCFGHFPSVRSLLEALVILFILSSPKSLLPKNQSFDGGFSHKLVH